MAGQRTTLNTTIQAKEDLSGVQFHAVAVNDGKLANNGGEALGILQEKPGNNEHATVAYIGEMRYRAAAAITAGQELTVTTSGWITAADSNDVVVGMNGEDSVTSGSIGRGYFVFPAGAERQTAITYGVTAADAILAGKAYTTADNKLANNGNEFVGIAPAAITSGSTGQIVVNGIVSATYANSYGGGQHLMATTSGYMTAVLSGYAANAISITAANSGSDGVVIVGGGAAAGLFA